MEKRKRDKEREGEREGKRVRKKWKDIINLLKATRKCFLKCECEANRNPHILAIVIFYSVNAMLEQYIWAYAVL